jgi:hypothetical protein
MSKGLLTLQTDLKSLRYGNDKPYVTKDINNAPSSNQADMRGTKRVDDLSRIAQMLVDRPGLKHLGNEALLRQVGVEDRIRKSRKSGKSIAGSILKELGGTLLATVKVAGSTLAQVPVNGTGTHFLRGFRTDTYLQPSGGNTRSAFAQFFGAGGVEGAPLALRGEEIIGTVETSLLEVSSSLQYDAKVFKEDYGDVNSNIVDNIPIVETSPRISAYNATVGNSIKVTPSGSLLRETTPTSGILGRSNQIKEADQPELLPNNSNDGKQKYSPDSTYTGKSTVDNISTILTYEEGATSSASGKIILNSSLLQDSTEQVITEYYNEKYINQTSSGTPNENAIQYPKKLTELTKEKTVNQARSSTNIEDFRKGSVSAYSYDYNSNIVNKEQRINLGNQGKAKSRVNYMITDPLGVDKVNASDVSNDRLDGTDEGRDLAKFYFEIITPDETKFLHFRAFINSVDDGYTADWQGHKYVGRAEDFYTYGGFSRDINVSFTIAAATRKEMRPLYRKMVYLASATAPTYGTGGLMRGTLARLTLGSYFSQIPGVITSVKYTLDNESPWEISLANPDGGSGSATDDDVQELPMVLQCSVSFKPIHDFAPQTGFHHYFTNPEPKGGAKSFLK